MVQGEQEGKSRGIGKESRKEERQMARVMG